MTAKVCESCREAAAEESEGFGLSASYVARTLGAEITDHLCEAREEGGITCACACNPRPEMVKRVTTYLNGGTA